MADIKEGELASGKKKKLMIIIIAIAVVVVLLGVAGTYFFMGSDTNPTELDSALDIDSGGSESADLGGRKELALYVPMPRAFRFNIPGRTRDRFVEIRVQLLVRGGENEANVKMHIPLIESTLLGVFSRTNAEDLATSVGKDALKQQSLVSIQRVMTDVAGNQTVEKVLFTAFVMQ
ncbi:MAG: flagellar basal body-associated protein FliL [Colwellia sp.]